MTPEKESAPACDRGNIQKADGATNATASEGAQGNTTAGKKLTGTFGGFSNLPAKLGVYRCKLWPETNKRDPNHADYKGVLQLTGSKASVLIWVHVDGTLGLRLEKITINPGSVRGAKRGQSS